MVHASASRSGCSQRRYSCASALPLLAPRSRAGPCLGAAARIRASRPTIGLLVGFEVANVDYLRRQNRFWIGSWVRIALALLLASASCVRVRRSPARGAARATEAGVARRALRRRRWARVRERVPVLGRSRRAHRRWPSIDGFSGAGAPAVAFGLLALAVVAAEGLRLAGVRPAKRSSDARSGDDHHGRPDRDLGLLSVIVVAHQLDLAARVSSSRGARIFHLPAAYVASFHAVSRAARTRAPSSTLVAPGQPAISGVARG